MCGVRSKVYLVISVLLLALSLPIYSDADYEINKAELNELETILTEQSETIGQQRIRLMTLSTTIEQQQQTIDELKKSLTEYESAETGRQLRTATVSFSVGVGVGAVVVAIFR